MTARWRTANPERVRAIQWRYDLKRRGQGITPEEWTALLATQSGGCAICGREGSMTRGGAEVRLSIDHDHKDGRIRGLLCAACNRALGNFHDDPALLARAIAYLAASNPKPE